MKTRMINSTLAIVLRGENFGVATKPFVKLNTYDWDGMMAMSKLCGFLISQD